MAAASPLFAGDCTWTAVPSSSNWSLPANWGGTAPVANDALIFGNSGIATLNNDLAANLALNGITFNAGASVFTLGGNAMNLNGNLSNNSSVTQAIALPMGLQAATVVVSGNSDVSFSGKLTSGILGGIAGANRTLTNNLSGAAKLTLGAIDLSIDPDTSVRTLTLNGAADVTINGPVANGSSAVAAANKLTYAGTGTLTISGSTGSTYTGSTTLSSGSLVLDFSSMAVPSNLLGLTNLTLGGAATLKGKNAAAVSQTFNGITTSANRAASLTVVPNGATTVDVTLGGMTRNAQSTMDFVLPASGSVTTTSANTANGIATNSSNSAYQTVGGTTWLTKSGTGPYTLSGLPAGSYGTTYTAATNVDVAGGDSVSGVTVNSLRFSGAPNKLLGLDGVNTVATGGVLVTPVATGSMISGGTIRGNANGASRELILINHASLEVASNIADNGSNSGLTLSGPGTTTLSGNNTFTGAVSINQGITKLGVSQVGTTSSPLGIGNAAAPSVTIASGAVLDLNGFNQTIGTLGTAEGAIRNSSGQPSSLTVKNNGIQNGINIIGGDINLISDIGSGNQYQLNTSLKNFSGSLSQRSGNIRSNNFSADFSNALIVLDVAAAGAIGTNGTLGTNNRLYLNAGTGNLPNDIEVLSNGFIAQNASGRTLTGRLSGSGVLNIMDGSDTLTADNSAFTGTFNLWQAGTTILFNSSSSSSQAAKFTFSTEGTLSSTSAYVANMAAGGTVHMGELSTTGATSNSRLRNNVNNTTATFSVGALGTDSSFGGVIANGSGTNQITALTKVGTGKLTLTGSSTYTGNTTVQEGTLAILAPRSISASSPVNVSAGAKLAGTGIFPGTVTAAGSIAPGTSVGTLTTGPTTLTGSLDIEVSGVAADKLVVSGNLNISGATLNVTELSPATQPSYVIAEATSLTGTFAIKNLPAGYSVAYTATQIIINQTGSGYDAWKTLPANGLTAGVNDGVNDDPDHDGVANLLEFVFGGVPAGTGASSQSGLPACSLTPTHLVLSFKRTDLSEGDVTIKVQWTNDLSLWSAAHEVAIGATSAGMASIAEDSPSAALDTVEVSIPRTEESAGHKLFARVLVSRP